MDAGRSSTSSEVSISVCLCTYMRPELLRLCLEHLFEQDFNGTFEVIVVDNDEGASAESVVASFSRPAHSGRIRLRYVVEPRQNISLARNAAVALAVGTWVAFIDDDEYPVKGWLSLLLYTLRHSDVDGVFGPVIPIVPAYFPSWLSTAKAFDGPRMATGSAVAPRYFRTSNALILAAALRRVPGPFDERLGRTGGEDSWLFRQLYDLGCSFRWCDEAFVCEVQEPQRARAVWHLKRAYRCGWSFARERCHTVGALRGALLVSLSAIGGLSLVVFRSLGFLPSLRAFLFLLARGLAACCGKLAYFFGLKIEVYRKRSAS